LVTFGIPLMIVPLRWARAFRWEVPQPENLVVFLGRSLGVLISLLAVFAIKVTSSPAAKPFFFDLMLWLFVGMIALHAYGALRKTQPITETVEILLWVVLFLITLCFYPQ
jgi:predicted membrane channel-forming protein YqfA (hemolysin III family)